MALMYADAERKRVEYRRRQEKGLCVQCGGKRRDERKVCAPCRERKRGYNTVYRRKPGQLPRAERQTGGESPRWRELEASTARCRCGLLLPCENCLPTSAAELAENHGNPGPTYPGSPL